MADSMGQLQRELRPTRSRLTAAEDRPRFHPWTRAQNLQGCQLYWLPVSEFPVGVLQRRWLERFQILLAERAQREMAVAPEVFLEMRVLQTDLRPLFIKHSREYYPLFGLGRHPGRAMPEPIDAAYVEDLQKGRRKFDATERQPDYCYWFLQKDFAGQMHLFFGVGGSTVLFLAPEKPAAPIRKPRPETIHDDAMREMVAKADLDGMARQLQNLNAPFLKQSKTLFASDLEEMPEYPGLLFTVPLLDAADFFAATSDEIGKWASLFQIYLRESPADKGMLLAAFDEAFEEHLEAVLRQMRAEGLEYRA